MMAKRSEGLVFLLGKLVYTWTNTESMLIYLMGDLMGTSKPVAIVTFLTLNTTRARLDFVERLAKLPAVPTADRKAILAMTSRMKTAAKQRNKYNHCVYEFNQEGEMVSTQLLRIAEYSDSVRYGRVDPIDAPEIERLNHTIAEIQSLNTAIQDYLKSKAIVFA
jgi:hypothetical protein